MATGAIWTLAQRLAVRSLALVSMIVLARLLIPEQFGIVAMAVSVLAMIEVFTGLRFDAALIRDLQATRVEYDTAWTLNLLLGVAVALVLVLVAPQAAAFFGEPRAEAVMYVVALNPLLEGFRNIGCVDFRKNFQFHKELQLEVSRKLVGLAVTVSLAVTWRSHWALVLGSIAGNAAYVAASYFMHPYRPRLTLAARRALLGVSSWLLAVNVLNFLRMKGANFVIGRLSGPAALGTFTVAYDVANLPTTDIVMPINRAVLPGYARMVADPQALQWGLLQVIAAIAVVAIPAAVGVASLAEILVTALLGSKWLAAIPVIQLLAIAGALAALETNLSSLYFAVGRPKLMVTRPAIVVVILFPLLLLFVREDGIRGAGIAYILAGLASLPINYSVALRITGATWRQLLGVLVRPVVGAVVMALVLQLVKPGSAAGLSSLEALARLVPLVASGATVYVVVVLILWWSAGRPSGAETFALGKLEAALERVGWRRRDS